MVGTSGASGERRRPVTPSARSLPDLTCRQAGRGVGDHHVDLAAQQVGDRERIALVRHVQQLHAGHLLQQFACDAAAGAAAAKAQLAGRLLGLGQKFAHGLGLRAGFTTMIWPPLPSSEIGAKSFTG